MATQCDREIELSQTNRGVGGVCVGVVPCVQSKLSRALHAHRGKKLLQDLQTQESAATKRAMVRFRGAREKGAMAFVECLGFSLEDTMEGLTDFFLLLFLPFQQTTSGIGHRVCFCCLLHVYSGRQFGGMYQPGSHRRNVTQDFSSTFLLRCMPLFFSEKDSAVHFPRRP